MAKPLLLTNFPGLCLLSVIKHIPLGEVIRNIRRVHPVLVVLAQQQLRSRSTLILLESPEQFNRVRDSENCFYSQIMEFVRCDNGSKLVTHRTDAQIQFDVLRLPQNGLTELFTLRLIETLPNITHLTIIGVYVRIGPAFAQLVRLLNHYASNLISLHLSFVHNYYNFNESYIVLAHEWLMNAPSLIETINRMTSLRHLKLSCLLPRLFNDARLAMPRLTILTQLDTFSCSGFGIRTAELTTSLREHANGHVRIKSLESFRLDDLLSFDRHLCSRFIFLGVVDFGVINDNVTLVDNVRLFCTQYSSLVRVEMSFKMLPWHTLAQCLSKLTQLAELSMSGGVIAPPEDKNTPLNIVPVPSVGFLTFSFNTRSHLDSEQLYIAELFPRLQVFHFSTCPLECPQCDYEIGSFRANPNRIIETQQQERIRECLRLTRQPLRRCTRVRTFGIRTDLDLRHLEPNVGIIAIDQL